KPLQRLFVADEIVVDEFDHATPSEAVEGVQLGQHLIIGLGPRHTSVELDDVAEFAGERTAAGELHADGEIIFELEQVEPRGRALASGDWKLARLESDASAPAMARRDEVGHDVLGLADDLEIRFAIDMRTGGRIRPPDGDRYCPRAAHSDDVERIALLNDHAAG